MLGAMLTAIDEPKKEKEEKFGIFRLMLLAENTALPIAGLFLL